MTTTVEQKRREFFEATSMLPDGVQWSDEAGQYVGPNFWLAQYAWLAVNQAIDAVVIELPEYHEIHGQRASEVYDGCRSAIQSTGLGLKVTP
jgi:hypothetical protein